MVKPKFPETSVSSDHPDFATLAKVRDAMFLELGGAERLREQLPIIIKNAVDFVLDPAATLRTKISELDSVEKTFIGLKIEHYLRDLIGCPKGSKRDAKIAEIDVDIKNTLGQNTWMIAHDYGSEPCILIATVTTESNGSCWLGLIISKDAYLTAKKGNNDKKRSISKLGKQHIMWLVREEPYPPSRWQEIDMERFKQLRRTEKTGNKRAAHFFSENMGKIIHRTLLEALLYDQEDPMRRVRGDKAHKGARELLDEQGVTLLCGSWPESRQQALDAGITKLAADEWVAVKKK
jgi:Restriction endonuclease NaeI